MKKLNILQKIKKSLTFKDKSCLMHPFLFGLFPVLALYAFNLGEATFTDILLPLSVVLGCVLLLIILLNSLLKNPYKISIFISIFILIFFSYGHILELLKKYFFSPYNIYLEMRLFYSLCGVLFLFTLWLIFTKKKLVTTTRIFNKISLILVIMAVAQIIIFEAGSFYQPDPLTALQTESSKSDKNLNPKDYPDIYYIILDGYAGEWTLKNIYNFDNSDFYDFLRKQGFYVVPNAYSNYAHTILSLASSLNMEYVNKYIDKEKKYEKKKRILYDMIQNNKVLKTFKQLGYSYIHFGSTISLTKRNPYADININSELFDEFDFMLINNSILFPFIKKSGISNILRRNILNTFRKLPEVALIKKPTFTFAHIMCPHPPYIFDKEGRPVKPKRSALMDWEKKDLYIEQLFYTNHLVKDVVQKIKINSKTKPIIILQSDHGTGSLQYRKKIKPNPQKRIKERLNILKALLISETEKKRHYENLSPVNTFRTLLKQSFKIKINKLENTHFYSPLGGLFLFKKTNLTRKEIARYQNLFHQNHQN